MLGKLETSIDEVLRCINYNNSLNIKQVDKVDGSFPVNTKQFCFTGDLQTSDFVTKSATS